MSKKIREELGAAAGMASILFIVGLVFYVLYTTSARHISISAPCGFFKDEVLPEQILDNARSQCIDMGYKYLKFDGRTDRICTVDGTKSYKYWFTCKHG